MGTAGLPLPALPLPAAPEAATAAWRVGQAIVAAALAGAAEADLVATLQRALAAESVDLSAIQLRCDVVDADRADRLIRWHRDPGGLEDTSLAATLFRTMLRDDVTERRVPTQDGAALRRVSPKATDAVAIAGHLAPAVTLGLFDDVMALFVTERPGGFTAADLACLRAVMPVFVLAMGARLNAAAARTLLQTYLGQDAATALLDGQVGLGDVATLRAVVLYCDLAGFTALTERLDPAALIARLNLFFETITRPMALAGGQVAGHVGDAVVVFFPIASAEHEGAVCAAAVSAVRAAMAALARLDTDGALAPLRVRIGIDVGPLVHGNIGSPGRFSFTVIGTPVNRAARLQALAKPLGAAVLMSAALATTAGVSCRAFGQHSLKGFDDPVDAVGWSDADPF